jgi:hypothetical protein
MNCVPSGAASSRQGVFPPYLHVAGSTVGVDPRTPQKLNFATGAVIFLNAQPCAQAIPAQATNGKGSYFDVGSGMEKRQ